MFGDCHIHMVLDGVYYRAAIDHQKENPDEDLIRERLSSYAKAGITYLRDGGDAWNVSLVAAGIAPEYGIDYKTPVYPIYKKGRYGSFIGRGFLNLNEYRELVIEAKSRGADFIKIMISGLMDFDHFGIITSVPLDGHEISEMISIAHGEGLAVMAHANGSETVKAAVQAGVDSVEHGAYMADETIEVLAGSDTVWVPTLVTIGNLIGSGRFPDSVLKSLLKYQMDNVGKCAQMGGKIALGSDAGAFKVSHVQGAFDEYGYLKKAIGDETDRILCDGEKEIRSRFSR